MITYRHPNGTQGTGAFFYEYWQRSIPSDDVFDIDYNVTEKNEKNANFIFEKFKDNADEIMKQTGTNGFLQVYYHWSEDPRKDAKSAFLIIKQPRLRPADENRGRKKDYKKK